LKSNSLIHINDIEEISGSFDVGGTVAFTVHPTFYDGTVAVYFDGALQASAWVDESSWSYSQIANRLIDPTVLTTGPHTIKVIATAANQSKTEAQITFKVNNTPKVTIDEIGKLEGFIDIKGSVDFQEATSVADGTLSLNFPISTENCLTHRKWPKAITRSRSSQMRETVRQQHLRLRPI